MHRLSPRPSENSFISTFAFFAQLWYERFKSSRETYYQPIARFLQPFGMRPRTSGPSLIRISLRQFEDFLFVSSSPSEYILSKEDASIGHLFLVLF